MAIIAYSYDELVSSWCPSGVKPPSEMDMTDGCGLINLQALCHLHEQLSLWNEIPTALQCRLAGAKVFSLPNTFSSS
jgi:RNA-dependent RNA polymerase